MAIHPVQISVKKIKIFDHTISLFIIGLYLRDGETVKILSTTNPSLIIFNPIDDLLTEENYSNSIMAKHNQSEWDIYMALVI